MKFEVSSSDLLKKLQVSNGAIGSNPVLPVLEDFLFDLLGNTLTIASSDLETSIINSLDVSGKQDGKIAVPAKILLETLKALPEQPIVFTVETENRGITLQSSYGEYKLAGDAAEDFPELPTEQDVESVEIESARLSNAITKTMFATSSDELRLAMTGVLMQVDYNKIIFVATDAHKLVKYTFGDVNIDVASSFIIPKKSLGLLRNAIAHEEGLVKISFNPKNVFFNVGGSKVICRLIDAKYPDYNAVIPVENPYLLALGRRDFQSSLKRIAIYSNKTTNQVILNITENSMTISAQDLDFSNEATEQMSCTYTGEPMTIGFNAKLLIEMLGVLESDEIKIELSTPNRAGILLPSEQNDNETLLMLVMPVMMSH